MIRKSAPNSGLIFMGILISLLLIFSSSVTQSRPTAILGAFSEETAWLDSQLVARKDTMILGLKFTTGELADKPVVLALTGIGKVNAAVMTALLIEHFQPSEVIFTGVAGGLNPDLQPGDVVIGTKMVHHDLADVMPDSLVRFGVRNPVTGIRNPVFLPADSALLELARSASANVEFEEVVTSMGERLPKVISGIIATGDAFIASMPKKLELRGNLSADAVEMEGAAVAQVCYQFEVPFLVIRALSDNADEYAEEDFFKFYQVAARNANRVVLGIIEELSVGSEEKAWKVYKDGRYGFEFQYPSANSLELLQDPQGGLIRAILKDPDGRDLAKINLDNISNYPASFQREELATFQDAAIFIAKNMSSADGPDGSRYCSEVKVDDRFLNPSDIEILQLHLTETVEKYISRAAESPYSAGIIAGTTTTEPRGPVYVINLETSGMRLILFVEPTSGSEMSKEDFRSIVNTVRQTELD